MSKPTDLLSVLPITEEFRPEYLRDCGMLPLRLQDERLHVAVRGAPPAEVLEDLELFYGTPLELVPVDAEALDEAIRRTFAAHESVVELVRGLEDDVSAGDPSSGDEPTDPLASNTVGVTFGADGGFTVSVHAKNSIKTGAPAIDATINFTPNAQGSFTARPNRDRFPSVEAYHWRAGTATPLLQRGERTPFHLFPWMPNDRF